MFEKRAMKAAPSSVNRQDNDSVMGRAGGAVSSFWLNICNQKLATWLQGHLQHSTQGAETQPVVCPDASKPARNRSQASARNARSSRRLTD